MATKRTQRIDPNAAFNAIIGITPPATSMEENGVGEGTAVTTAPPAKAELDTPAELSAPLKESTPVQAPPKATLKTDDKEDQGAKKLVQKGYYLTEEQVRQLGITAVMNGVDRSSIVREALDLYFASHTEMLP